MKALLIDLDGTIHQEVIPDRSKEHLIGQITYVRTAERAYGYIVFRQTPNLQPKGSE